MGKGSQMKDFTPWKPINLFSHFAHLEIRVLLGLECEVNADMGACSSEQVSVGHNYGRPDPGVLEEAKAP